MMKTSILMRSRLLLFTVVVGAVSGSTPCLEQCRNRLEEKALVEPCEAGCGYAQVVPGLSLREKCSRDCSSAYAADSDEIVACCRGCTYRSYQIKEKEKEEEAEKPVEDEAGSEAADEVEEESPVRRVIIGVPVRGLISRLLGRHHEEEEEERSPRRIMIGSGGPPAGLSRLIGNLFGRHDDDGGAKEEEEESPRRIIIGSGGAPPVGLSRLIGNLFGRHHDDGGAEKEEEESPRRIIIGSGGPPAGLSRLIGNLFGRHDDVGGAKEEEEESPRRIIIGSGGAPPAGLSRMIGNLFGRHDDDEEEGSSGRIVVGGPPHFGGLLSNVFGGGDDDKGPFGRLFGGSSMMDSMINRFMKDFRSGNDGDATGSGKLTVVKSGPGYREEKTYRFGSSSDLEPSKILSHEVDDMMMHQNPLEMFQDPSQVETFNPKLDEEERKTWNPKVGKLPNEPAQQQGEGVDFGSYVFVGDVCSLDRSQMSWSDWFSCLGMMGLSSWLLAASVALGLLFVLWMCFFGSPCGGRARMQKLREAKLIGTKEVEAGIVVGGAAAMPKKVELPPPYNDVVDDFGREFTAKIDLGGAEPLPDKKKRDEAAA